MKPKHQRLIFVVLSVVSLSFAVIFTLRAFEDNLVFFMSPSDIAAKPPAPSQKIRVGGLVKKESLVRGENAAISFIISDGKHELTTHYTGLLPNLFREGQGVVAEGIIGAKGELQAQTILAKHDENYMPKEVVDALKASGHWEEQYKQK